MNAPSDRPDPVTPPASILDGLLDLLQVDEALLAVKEAGTGRYVWANAAYRAWLGVSDDRPLAGATDLELLSKAEAAALQAADARALATEEVVAVDDHRFERDGVRLEFHALRHVVTDAEGHAQIITLWREVSEARRNASQLQQALDQIERQQQSFETLRRQHAQGLDRPSELFRREHFEEHLRREAALSQREHREFALVLLAVDRLDALRQAHGEAAVQQVVETMGHLMRTNTRAMDVLSQLGDDTSAILIYALALPTALPSRSNRPRACATHVVVQGGQGFNFEVSIGVASFPHTAATLSDLSQAAVRALTDARQRGGNRVALASIRLGEAVLVE